MQLNTSSIVKLRFPHPSTAARSRRLDRNVSEQQQHLSPALPSCCSFCFPSLHPSKREGHAPALSVLNVRQCRPSSVTTECRGAHAKIAGAATFASTESLGLIARVAVVAAFASTEGAGADARIVVAAAFASMEGAGVNARIVGAAAFASMEGIRGYARIVGAAAFASMEG